MEYNVSFTKFKFSTCLHTVGRPNLRFSVSFIIALSHRFFHSDRNKNLGEILVCAAENASVSRRICVYDHMCLQYSQCRAVSQAKAVLSPQQLFGKQAKCHHEANK